MGILRGQGASAPQNEIAHGERVLEVNHPGFHACADSITQSRMIFNVLAALAGIAPGDLLAPSQAMA